jgi:predicted nucleic acid-binding protein
MPESVVVDAGPLIALFNSDDDDHADALEFVKAFPGRLLTNLAVVTEVVHLLDFSIQVQTDFLRWLSSGGLTLVNLESSDYSRIIQLMIKYADLPMDFADASIVAICERLGIRKIASIDRDFKIYRFRDRFVFHNVFR